MMYSNLTLRVCDSCQSLDVMLHKWDKEFYCGRCSDIHDKIDAFIESEIDNRIRTEK